jgi:hypothetical protein
MWTLNEIWEWLQGKRADRQYQEVLEAEKIWKKGHNERMQKIEDSKWDRDIEHRAQTMLREWNHDKELRKIKAGAWPGSKYKDLYIEKGGIVLAPLPRACVYTVYDKATMKYPGSRDIEDAVSKRFGELLKKQEDATNT